MILSTITFPLSSDHFEIELCPQFLPTTSYAASTIFITQTFVVLWLMRLCKLCVQACKDYVCADLSPYQNHGQFCGEKCVAWDIKVSEGFFMGEIFLSAFNLCFIGKFPDL